MPRKTKRNRALDPHMEAVLAQLCDEIGSLYKTQAVKLPYLVDVVASHVLGREIAGGPYHAWDHGVVATDVYSFITRARYEPGAFEGSRFLIQEQPGYEDRQIIELVGSVPELLDGPEREVVEFVATQYGRMSPTDMGKLTKELNQEILRWPSSKRVMVNEVAYERLPVAWDAVDAEIARRRLVEIEEDPGCLVSGSELESELKDLLT